MQLNHIINVADIKEFENMFKTVLGDDYVSPVVPTQKESVHKRKNTFSPSKSNRKHWNIPIFSTVILGCIGVYLIYTTLLHRAPTTEEGRRNMAQIEGRNTLYL